MIDMHKRKRFNPNSKSGKGRAGLYEEEIWLIRKLKAVNYKHNNRIFYKFSSRYIAKMFKVGSSTILRIWNSDKFMCREGYYI
jgi:hypothetical protein